MGKRYIFLGICILFGFTIVYFGRVDDHVCIEEFEHDIDDIRLEGNQTIEYAEEVLDVFIEQREVTTQKIESLDELVHDRELTIEEKMGEVSRLLIQANKFRDLAEDNAEIAQEMERMANKEKERAQLAKMEAQVRLNKSLSENQKLIEQIKSLQQTIKDLTPMGVDTLEVIEPPKKDKRKKKGN